MTTPSSGTEGELCLTISPYGYIEWRGPRAKLECIGVVPAHIEWPRRIDHAQWHADGFAYMLRRCRPDGLKGPMRGWMNCDCWYVQCFVPRSLDQSLSVRKPHIEIGALLAQALSCGDAPWIHFSTRRSSGRIETLRARLVPDANAPPGLGFRG